MVFLIPIWHKFLSDIQHCQPYYYYYIFVKLPFRIFLIGSKLNKVNQLKTCLKSSIYSRLILFNLTNLFTVIPIHRLLVATTPHFLLNLPRPTWHLPRLIALLLHCKKLCVYFMKRIMLNFHAFPVPIAHAYYIHYLQNG